MDKHRVVIIDDHPMVCAAIRALLVGGGQFEVVAERHTGTAGLAAVRELAPALVVVDLDVPVLGGIEIIRRVRASDAKIAIVVISAADETTHGLRVLRMGANAFVHKGSAMAELATACQMALHGRAYFSQDVLAAAANYPQRESGSVVDQLSEREFEVFRCLAQGQSNVEIAAHMLISNKTISAHKRRLMARLGLSSIRDLIDLARSQGVV